MMEQNGEVPELSQCPEQTLTLLGSPQRRDKDSIASVFTIWTFTLAQRHGTGAFTEVVSCGALLV
jgi:hypothetical protein